MGALSKILIGCIVITGCNSVLANTEHDFAAADASSRRGDAGVDAHVGGGSLGDDDASVDDRDVQTEDAPVGVAPDADEGDVDVGDGGAAAPIAFVQVASRDTKNHTTTVSVDYSKPQRSGDLAVVVVGWSDPKNTVRGVADSAGNTYRLAAPAESTSGVALAIYYAVPIVAASVNTVTVDMDNDDYPCVAIAEYSGVTALDQTVAASGSSSDTSSGAVTTAFARELLLGAGEPDQNGNEDFTSAGSGFDERVITSVSGMLVEDRIVSQTGSYAATGSLSAHSGWVMQIATFR